MPLKTLTDDTYLKQRMSSFNVDKATLSFAIKEGKVNYNESMATTHYSILDQFVNAISATTTLNAGYRLKYYCDTLGLFLNNEIDDLIAKQDFPTCLTVG
jgi:gamma-glutamyltranspeptidase/glutathione hydrolase